MTARTPAPIRSRPDGSIDINHYTRRGRQARSDALHGMIARRSAPGAPGLRLIVACLGLIGLTMMR